ncbi:MAG: 7TM diverse intracellular signaling domain-containing protein, partial [Flavobacteriales bacterium]
MFLYIGIILVLILYNLFLGISTNDINYLKYSGYILSIAITQIGLFGYGDRFIWGNNVWLTQNNVHLLGAISGITTILYARSFLRTKDHTPIIDKVLLAYVGFDLVAILLTLLGNYEMAYNLINFNAASSIILLIAGFQSMRKGNKSARFFLLAWSIFIFACTIFAMKDFGVLPYNFITSSSLPIGSALEGILLSFALADRINQLKLEKAKSDADLITTIQNQNEMLESRVHDRTAELEEAKNELQSQYDHLRITQKQLVESEKLAGLGQMTAGIAHELNNPINFVQSNVAPLHRDIDEIMEVLTAFNNLPQDASPADIAAVKAKCQSIGLDYLTHEINALLKGIAEGSRRTAEIVKGLRIFARTDSDTRIMANINECIHSTLVVMKTMTKGQVKLNLDLDPSMPDIDCFPGKINQVVANLISNAVHATQQRFDDANQRHIAVCSRFDDQNAIITIRDNGSGIDADKLAQIFVPFFTTKQVGEGTGLGLSIAKGIVEEHGGTITVQTQVQEGTEFTIHLPLTHKSNAKNERRPVLAPHSLRWRLFGV